jgi:DNA-binding MarR family transcriptional regulator
VARLYSRRFEARARELPLTLTQCKALAVLANCEGVSQTRLAEIGEVDPARLVCILDRLEAGGWAGRRSDPQDRRAHVLAITENAKPVVERVWEIVQDTNTEALKGLTNDELHLLMDVAKPCVMNEDSSLITNSMVSARVCSSSLNTRTPLMPRTGANGLSEGTLGSGPRYLALTFHDIDIDVATVSSPMRLPTNTDRIASPSGLDC